ncbi:MAG TPA: hypothetical protein VGQ65_00750 [Thermoanaerobaculia bacterium]|jgi:hypothetical protein|nr:hypothetical protein [Thermoanaerobaculia bacterium]
MHHEAAYEIRGRGVRSEIVLSGGATRMHDRIDSILPPHADAISLVDASTGWRVT